MVGGPCNYSVTPSPNWTFGFGTSLGFGLGELDLGIGLDNLDFSETTTDEATKGHCLLMQHYKKKLQ